MRHSAKSTGPALGSRVTTTRQPGVRDTHGPDPARSGRSPREAASYVGTVDLRAVKEAPVPVLARGAVAAARNARGLVQDAELLSGAGRLARAYSLAGLAVEEVGKAGSLADLTAMPENLRAPAPVGRMLEWHQMKLVAGQLIAAVPLGVPGAATRFVTMPLSEVAEILDSAQASARDADRLKQRGLYVDVDRSGHVREPSEVAAADVLLSAVTKLRG